MTGNTAYSLTGRRLRWLAILVAATSLSGCMASALDPSAISTSQAGQGFSFTDEAAFSGMDAEGALAATPPAALGEEEAATVAAYAGDEPLTTGSTTAVPATARNEFPAAPGGSDDNLDAATARIYSAAGPQIDTTPRPPVSGIAKRTGALLSLFSNRNGSARKAVVPPAPVSQNGATAELWSAPDKKARPLIASASAGALPGVDRDRALGLNNSVSASADKNDKPIRVASAAGLARLAPNGLRVQHDKVDISCLKPALVRVLKQVEGHYGRSVVVTSGFRSPSRNKKASGASNSLHMYCSAADIQIEGVSKTELASYLRDMPGRGGVGTYCHTQSVHIDIGPKRDWNWRCRRRK